VRLLPFKGAAGAVAVVAPALLGSLEGSELRDNCFAVVVRHERVNQPLRFRHHAAGVLRFHASAFHLGSELTRLELKGEHGLSPGGFVDDRPSWAAALVAVPRRRRRLRVRPWLPPLRRFSCWLLCLGCS